MYQKYNLGTGWIKVFLYSGSLNLVIGYLIGPHVFGLLSDDIMGKLYVLVGLVLGWAGFLIGLQAKIGELKRFQRSYYTYSMLNFICILTGLLALIIILNQVLDLSINYPTILIVTILGTVSSPILLGLLKERLKLRGPFIHLLQFSVGFDNMLGVIVFGLSMLLISQKFYQNVHFSILILAALTFSAFMAWLFIRISDLIDNVQQFFLVLVGFLLVIDGVALNLNISVLLISFVFGVVLTNLPVDTRKLYQSIANAEKPLYYLMMVFIGSSIGVISWEIALIVVLFTVMRLGIKYVTGYLSCLVLESENKPNPKIGLSQIGMGGIALAMALDFHLSMFNQLSRDILFVVSMMAILNVIISPFVFRALEKK